MRIGRDVEIFSRPSAIEVPNQHWSVPGGDTMKIQTFDTSEAAAQAAAAFIAAEARAAIAARDHFSVAFSGGHTPWQMLQFLAAEALPWDKVHVAQVDERVAPANDPGRNFIRLLSALRAAPIPLGNHHAMPVEAADLEAAALVYAATLRDIAGTPPVFDLIQLGLGADGHTASLTPGAPVLGVTDADVALSGVFEGKRRMTMTLPILNRARRILWLVTGHHKASILARLRASDPSIPASRIRREHAVVFTDIKL